MRPATRGTHQGERQDRHTVHRQRHKAALAVILFHPDYDRRLRIRTGSAPEGVSGLRRRKNAITTGGDFHPALRTYSR